MSVLPAVAEAGGRSNDGSERARWSRRCGRILASSFLTILLSGMPKFFWSSVTSRACRMLPVMSRQATAPGHPPSRTPTAVVIAASDVSGAAVDGSLLQPHRHERRRVAAAGGEADDARAPARHLLQRHGWDGRSERSHESSGSALCPRSTAGWELSLGSDGEKNHNDVA